MFGQEDKFKISHIARPVIAIINCYSEWTLFQKHFEIGKEYKYSFYCSVSHLYEQYQEYFNFDEEGLLNIKWHLSIFPKLPSLIICLFEVKDSFESDSNTFITEVTKIKNIDKCVNVIVLVKYQKNSLTLPIDKKDILETFHKVTDKPNIFITNAFDESNLHIIKKLRASVDNYSMNYYINYCNNLNNKIQLTDNNEDKIRTIIKMGIIKIISSSTINDSLTYQFAEAYKLLIKIVDNMNLYNENDYIKFCEYRSIADWLIINMLYIKQQTESSHDMIDKCNKHFIYFSMHSKLIQENSFANINMMYKLYNCYWIYIRIDSFKSIFENSKDKTIQSMYAENLLNKVYNFIRCVKIINVSFKNLSTSNSVKIEGNEILLSSISQQANEIFEKAPSYIINNKDVIGFNNDIYLIEFIQKKKLNEENLKNIFRNELLPQVYNVLDNIRTQEFSYLKLYLNHLLIELDLIYNETESVFFDIKQIYSKLNMNKNIVNFEKLYFGMITKFNMLLINKLKTLADNESNKVSIINNKITLIKNFILLANHRSLSNDEQQMMYNYMQEIYNEDIKSIIYSPQDLIINVIKNVYFTNRLFNCKFIINQPLFKNNFNLIQYDFEISSEFSIGKFPLYNIEIIFDNNDMNKTLICHENENISSISSEHPIKFSYAFILINKNESLFLSKIKLVLDFPTKVCYYIEFPKTNQSIIKTDFDSKGMLSLNYKKNVSIGTNEYYNCNIEINKRNIPMLNIKDIRIEFYSERNSNEEQNHKLIKNQNTLDIKAITKNSNVIYYEKDENGNVNETKQIVYEMKSYDDNKINSFSFLVKHLNEGVFYLKGFLTYSIYIDDPSLNGNITKFEYSSQIIFNVIDPFNYKFKIYCPFHIKDDNSFPINRYPTNKPIQIKLFLNNKLNKSLTLSKMNIKLKNQDSCTITSIIQQLLSISKTSFINNSSYEIINQSALTIKERSEFLIPFNCIFKEKISNISFGEIELYWTTPSLQTFSTNIYNVNTFIFPQINVESVYYNLHCELGTIIPENKSIPLYIHITNTGEEIKKVLLSYENISDNFYYDGFFKRNLILFPNEPNTIELILYPLYNGYIKLPQIKLTELKLVPNSKEKLITIIYNPEPVYIKI